MIKQKKVTLEEVPITDKAQERYHAIAPCLAGKISLQEQAEALNISFTTLNRWLEKFRTEGLAGLVETKTPRQPYTPERVIVTLLFYKCCVPKVPDRELARVVGKITGHRLHNETVKSLLERYFFWKYAEFRDQIKYPVPTDPKLCRLEMVKLQQQGWSEKTIATLLRYNRHTIHKWLRRYKVELLQSPDPQLWLLDQTRKTNKTGRKVYFGTIRAVLELQRKYGCAGWFRIQSYLERDYSIKLSETTIKKIMRLNRRLHLAPSRPIDLIVKQSKEGPKKSKHPLEHVYTDFRYLDAKPEKIQLYSCLLLDGYSRAILAGSLTDNQETEVLLKLYYKALLEFGCWEEIITDNGGQFLSNAFARINRRLKIYHHKNDKGHPWQNLIESNFGIQARVGEYGWERCNTVEEAIALHQQLIYDHNHLPHFAHRFRKDEKHTPFQVLGQAYGREIDRADLHRAFSRKFWERTTDEKGYIRLNQWRLYIEAGLPKTPIQVLYWDKKLRAEFDSCLLAEFNCRWDRHRQRPMSISKPLFFETSFHSPQLSLFDPFWNHNPKKVSPSLIHPQQPLAVGQQLELYFGPKIIK